MEGQLGGVCAAEVVGPSAVIVLQGSQQNKGETAKINSMCHPLIVYQRPGVQKLT